MKPIEGTFDRNALKHGVAGLNIEDGRVTGPLRKTSGYSGGADRMESREVRNPAGGRLGQIPKQRMRRWPANLILTHDGKCRLAREKKAAGNDRMKTDEHWDCNEDCPARMLDQQSGKLRAGGNVSGNEPSPPFGRCYGAMRGRRPWRSYDDRGGASRFFYCSKASNEERDRGLPRGMLNHHPTVKPLELMEYLCRLTATPDGGVVLDPFAGSGTTLLAAKKAGRCAIGIEIDPNYVRIAKHRLALHSRAVRRKARGKNFSSV